MTDVSLLKSFKNTKKGSPLLLHSFKPYSAFNFQTYAQFTLVGNYTWVGLMGISMDGENYIVARYNKAEVQLCKVRNGNLIVLKNIDIGQSDTTVSMMFSHKDGVFNIYLTTDGVFGAPVLSYRWKESDGVISVDKDLFHVGVYSFIDPPHFRITSFDVKNCDGIGYLPGTDLSAFESFLSVGKVQIDDSKYFYRAKTPNGLANYRGPYQVRSIGSASYTNPSSGLAFSGKTMEVSMFDWSDEKNDLNGYLLASDARYAWKINSVDRKVFINSSTWMRQRARFFCDSKGVVSSTHRAWVTCGLLDVTPVTLSSESASHNLGALCFLDSDDAATLHMFISSSGDRDATIGDLLEMVSKTAGIKPILSGNKHISNITLSSTRTSL